MCIGVSGNWGLLSACNYGLNVRVRVVSDQKGDGIRNKEERRGGFPTLGYLRY